MDLLEDRVTAPRVTRWGHALILAATEGVSLGVAVGSCLHSKLLPQFVATNHNDHGIRQALLSAIVASFLTVPSILLASCALPHAEGKRLTCFENYTKLLAPLCATGFVPLLLQTNLWKDKTLDFLLAAAVFSITVTLSSRAAVAAARQVISDKCRMDLQALRKVLRLCVSHRFELPVSIVAIVVFTVWAITRTLAAAKSLNLVLAGELPALQQFSHAGGMSFWLSGSALRLNGHVSIMGLVYAIWTWLMPKADGLLLLRLLAVSWPALPLYLWTRKAVGTVPAWVMTAAYLSVPLRAMLVPSEAFPVAFALGPFLLSAYYMEAKRFGWCLVFAVIAVLLNEQVAVWYIALGLYARARNAEGWFEGLLTMGAFIYFVWAAAVYLPNHQILTYSVRPQVVGSIVEQAAAQSRITALVNPAYFASRWFETQTLEFWLIALLPMGFLPLRNSRWLVWLLPAIALSFVAALNADWQSSTFTHFLAVGIVSGLASLRELRHRSANASGLDVPMYLGWVAAAVPCVALLGSLWFPNP